MVSDSYSLSTPSSSMTPEPYAWELCCRCIPYISTWVGLMIASLPWKFTQYLLVPCKLVWSRKLLGQIQFVSSRFCIGRTAHGVLINRDF